MRALCLVLVAGLAGAQEPEKMPSDKPLITLVKSGTAVVVDDDKGEHTVLLPSGSFINEAGMVRLNEKFQGLQISLIESTTQNEALRKKVDDIAADPPVNLKVILIVAGSALLLGTAAGVGVGYAIGKK